MINPQIKKEEQDTIKQRLIFLGAAVFFAMVTVIAFAAIQTRGHYGRWWFALFTGGGFCVLSLAGIIAPKKMQWLMDLFKKSKNKN